VGARRLAFGTVIGSLPSAVPKWLAREVETAEIRVYNRDGSLTDSRVISKAGQPEEIS